jgi:hypothetical protein
VVRPIIVSGVETGIRRKILPAVPGDSRRFGWHVSHVFARIGCAGVDDGVSEGVSVSGGIVPVRVGPIGGVTDGVSVIVGDGVGVITAVGVAGGVGGSNFMLQARTELARAASAIVK